MLATLSTLCSKQVQYMGYLKNVPLQILVIDEASQVEAPALIPILNKYGKSLQKICFLGDNKQCKFNRHFLFVKKSLTL